MSPLISLLALGAVAQGQATDPNEDRLRLAFEQLREEAALYLEIRGTDTLEGRGTQEHVTHLFWIVTEDEGKVNARIQVLQYQNEQLVQRIVANGENVWNYDLVNREYSAANYGGFGQRPRTYFRDVAFHLNSWARGQAAWGARLISEVYAAEQPFYRSWMPGVISYGLPEGLYPDPVWDGRVYNTTPKNDFVMYDSAPRRTIVFELEEWMDEPDSTRRLKSIYFNERSTVGGRQRLVEWQLTPFKGIHFDERNFQPYSADETRRWRPVVGPRPFVGG